MLCDECTKKNMEVIADAKLYGKFWNKRPPIFVISPKAEPFAGMDDWPLHVCRLVELLDANHFKIPKFKIANGFTCAFVHTCVVNVVKDLHSVPNAAEKADMNPCIVFIHTEHEYVYRTISDRWNKTEMLLVWEEDHTQKKIDKIRDFVEDVMSFLLVPFLFLVGILWLHLFSMYFKD